MATTPTCSRCGSKLDRHCASNTGKPNHPSCTWRKCGECRIVLDLQNRRGFDVTTGHPLKDTGANATPPGPKKPPAAEGP